MRFADAAIRVCAEGIGFRIARRVAIANTIRIGNVTGGNDEIYAEIVFAILMLSLLFGIPALIVLHTVSNACAK